MMKIAILGRGVSGRAAKRLAQSNGDEGILLEDGDDFASVLATCDAIVASPGMKPWSPLYQAAAKTGKPFMSELEYGFCHTPNPVIAITGTDGKTTTTELTCRLLAGAGVHPAPAGNIGFPLCEVVCDIREGKIPQDTIPVIEVSSFQLELVRTFAPKAAVLLNIDDDHQDRYPGGRAEYAAVKRRIFAHVAPENRIFGRSMREPGYTPRVTTTADGMILADGKELLHYHETQLTGEHNLENLCAALELALRVLTPKQFRSDGMREAAQSYHAGRHRIEPVGTVHGVRCINDSKATNPHAAAASICACERIHLLLGGLDKGMDFSSLRAFAPRIRHAYLYGASREKIRAALEPVIACSEYGTDFEAAIAAALNNAVPGDTVLLAPACASMDMFKNYQERGDRFRDFVQKAAHASTF